MRVLSLIIIILTASPSFAQKEDYKQARYYDTKGNRADGFINTSKDFAGYFQFKKTLQDNPEKIKTWRLSSVVVEQDSFAILRNFKVESDGSSGMIIIPYGLGKVLETGKVNLYDVTYKSDGVNTTMYTGASTGSDLFISTGKVRSVFIVQQQGSEKFIAVEKGITDFIKQMSFFLKMSPPIIEKLNNREYSYPKSPLLVHDFNEWYRSR